MVDGWVSSPTVVENFVAFSGNMRRARGSAIRSNRNAGGVGNQRRSRSGRQPGPLSTELRAMQAERTSGPTDPPSINLAIKSFYRGQLTVEYGPTTPLAYQDVKISDIAARIPASVASLRILKLSVYGEPSGTDNILIQMPGDTSFLNANSISFQDNGCAGARRAALHIIPAAVQRQRWYDPSGSDVVCRISSNLGSNTTVSKKLLQFSIEYQSKTLAPSA